MRRNLTVTTKAIHEKEKNTMGFLDNLLNRAGSSLQSAVNSGTRRAVNQTMNEAEKMGNNAIRNMSKKKKEFTFSKIPENLEELKALPQADLQDPFGVVALVILAMNNYNKNLDNTIEMMNYLKGPSPLMGLELSRMRDQLAGKDYLMRSYFEGTSPENNYKPAEPFKLVIFDHPNSYDNEKDGYVTLWVNSSGADSDRQVRLRKKQSTGQWFLNEEYLTPGIRTPKEADPWA